MVPDILRRNAPSFSERAKQRFTELFVDHCQGDGSGRICIYQNSLLWFNCLLYCIVEENDNEMHPPPAVATSRTNDQIENIGETLIDVEQVTGGDGVGPEQGAVQDQEEVLSNEVVVTHDEERISDGREKVEPRVVANEAAPVSVVDRISEVQQQMIGECHV